MCDRPICTVIECSTNDTGVQTRVESYQRLKTWYFTSPCLTLTNIRHGSRIKWNNPGKGVAPFPTFCWSSYWEGAFVSLSTTVSQFISLYIYIYIYRCSVWSVRVTCRKETITDAGYVDNIALLSNTPTQAESLLHSLKQAADSIGLHVNADKTEYVHFNKKVHISVNGRSDKFMQVGSCVLSTESDINKRLSKAWTIIYM